MKLLKAAISVLLTVIIFIGSFAIVICSDVNRTIFNPDYAKHVVQDTNSYTLIYNQIPSVISGLLPSEPPTAISRFFINNMSRKSLESQTNTIIDNFYGYLNGINRSTWIDLTPIKKEIESFRKNNKIQGIAESSEQAAASSLDIPSKVIISDPQVNSFINNLAWVYRFFHSLSIILLFIVGLCLILLFAVNYGTRRFQSYISVCLLSLGVALLVVYAFHNRAVGNFIPQILEQLQVSGFKMLSLSLYPILFSTVITIFNYVLFWSAVSIISGLFLTSESRQLFSNLILWIGNLFQVISHMEQDTGSPVQRQKEKEPQRAL